MSMKKTATSILIVMVIVCAAFAAGFVTGHKSPDLTAQELAQALDIHYYTIQVPDNIPEDHFAELRIMHYDGRSTGGAGFGQLKPKDKIKVFFWKEPESNDFSVSMTVGGSTNRFKLSDKFQPTGMFLTSYNDNSNVLKPGDYFLKCSQSNVAPTPKTPLQEGEYGMTILITDGTSSSEPDTENE